MLLVPRSLLTGMLNADEDRLIAIMNDGTACLGLVRHGEELHHVTSLITLDRHPKQPVGLGDRARRAIGRDPRLPTESNAMLSGQEIGATGPSHPPK